MKSVAIQVRALVLLLTLAAAASAFAADFVAVYHEASCPSVDTTRMLRLKRHLAVASGLVPAADCHPDLRFRYLGTSYGGARAPEETAEQRIHVNSHTKQDGTIVRSHTRSRPRQRE